MLDRISKKILTKTYKIITKPIPKVSRKISFTSFPDASDNSWHLYRNLAKTLDGYTFVWLLNSTPDTHTIKKIRLENDTSKNRLIIVKKNSALGLLHFASSKNIFHTHGTYSFANSSVGTQIVNLWHGMPLKKIGALDNKSKNEICYSDLILSTSAFFTKIMSDAFCTPEAKVLDLGLPRNDVLIGHVPIDRAATLSSLPFSPDQKFIMWLPTYRKSFIGDIRQDSKSNSFIDEWNPCFFNSINNLLKTKKAHLIIKLHPMDCLNNSDRLTNHSNIHFLPTKAWEELNIDLYDVLSFSSGLISDISSVIIDYHLTGKPIALTSKSIEEYDRGIINGISIEKDINPSSIKNPEDFLRFLSICITAPPKNRINPKLHSYRTESSSNLIKSKILNINTA